MELGFIAAFIFIFIIILVIVIAEIFLIYRPIGRIENKLQEVENNVLASINNLPPNL